MGVIGIKTLGEYVIGKMLMFTSFEVLLVWRY
jgi:hypothetical protein